MSATDEVEQGDAELLAVIRARSRAENRHAARKVMAAAVLWDRCMERDIELGNGDIYDCGNTAAAEIAVQLGCPKTMAEGYAEVGMDLRLRLPRVRARDRHCRFPGCRVPAGRCQIDHRVPFRHRSPITGGWTIRANLQCLCAFHHQLKTMGLWRSVGLPGAVVWWTSRTGTTGISLPAGAYVNPVDETILVPYIPCRREPEPEPEPPEPPEPPPF